MIDSKLKSAIYGLAVADAVGVPYEFKTRGSFRATDMVGYGSHNQPKGTWSDDTSMTLATCDSIKECGCIDASDMLAKFRAWAYKGKYAIDGRVFDIGCTTSAALYTGKGKDDERSNGNGSLMRIIPLAFADASDDEIKAVSAITHAHDISKAACVCYVHIVRALLRGEKLKDILESIESPFERLRTINTLDESEIKSGGYVVSTLEAALWAVSTTDNYRDAVLKVVNLGNDTDTVGAVAGGLAGIIYGFEGIPSEWIESLKGKDIIENCLF
nr:MAG TPA: ADP-ribosylglycohydrolase [Caudoviricetes sp.]